MLPTKLKERAELERTRLATGEKPEPKLQSPIQRTAVRALAAFFAVMFGLTLLSRAADGITVPRVQAERTQTGVLTQRLTARGTINPLEDLTVTLPGGILVSNIVAKEGQRVEAGDVLLELDSDDLRRQVTELEEKLRIVNLRLAAASTGATSADTDAVLEAQRLLLEKQEDYDRLKEKLERARARSDEDLTDARANYDTVLLDYDKVVEKVKRDLLKTAEEKVKSEKNALADTKESAAEAVQSAKDALANAEDTYNDSGDNDYDASAAMNRAEEAVKRAQAEADRLAAEDPVNAELLAAAKSTLLAAQSALDSARARADAQDNANASARNSVKRAKDNLKKIQDKWDQKVKDAEAKVAEAEREQEDQRSRTDFGEEAAVQSAQAAIDAAEKAVTSGQRGTEDGTFSAQEQLDQSQRAIEAAQRGIEDAKKKVDEAGRGDEKSRQQAEIERLGYLSEQRVLQQDLSALRSVSATGGQLTAPIAGLVKSIMAEPGATQQGGRLAVLSRADQGFDFSCKMEEKQAEKLAVGDKGKLAWTKEGKSFSLEVNIGTIGAADDKGMVEVTIDLPPDAYPTGASAELEVSKRSEKYDLTLPIGALRVDGQDQFVLVLREKQTVMGVEQTVEKVPIEVKEKDSERMGFTSAALGWDDMVVVSATKPLDKGDRVRLEEK